MLDVCARQKAVDADRVQHHQDGDEGDQGKAQWPVSDYFLAGFRPLSQPRDGAQLADLEGNAQANDGPEGAREDAG